MISKQCSPSEYALFFETDCLPCAIAMTTAAFPVDGLYLPPPNHYNLYCSALRVFLLKLFALFAPGKYPIARNTYIYIHHQQTAKFNRWNILGTGEAAIFCATYLT